MRHAPNPLLTAHRLARLNRWARLWFVWFAGFCAALFLRGGRLDKATLDRVARGTRSIILLNAAPYAPRLPISRHRHGRLKHASLRMLAGASMRRAMRGRDWVARLFAILAALRDMDRHIAKLLHRVRRGLTRLRRMTNVVRAVALSPAPVFGVVGVDTS